MGNSCILSNKKLSGNNYALLQLRDIVNTGTLLVFYYASINSILNYGLLCWGNSVSAKKVFIWQKRIIRTMFRLSVMTSCRTYFKKHNILTLSSLYILQAVCHIKKQKSNLVCCGDVNSYNTRSS